MSVVATLFLTASAALLVPAAVHARRDLAAAKSETAGLAYLSSIWGAMIVPDGALGAGQAAFDSRFGSADAAAAFAQAAGVDTRLRTGAALMGAVADGAGLTPDSDPDHHFLIQLLAVRLPALINASTELSQAVKIRDDGQAVRLALAADHLQAAGDQVQVALGAVGRRGTGAPLADNGATLGDAVNAMAGKAQAPEIAAAPDAIDAPQKALQSQIDRTWKAADDLLAQRLAAQLGSLTRGLGAMFALAAVGMVGGIAVAAQVAGGLARRLRAFEDAAERIGRSGGASAEIPYLDEGAETGRLARALDACRGQMADQERRIRLASVRQGELEDEALVRSTQQEGRSAEQAAATKALAGGLDRLAHGDLTTQIDGDFSAYQALVDDFNETVGWLREVIGAIADDAYAIDAGGVEMAKAAGGLARRSERRAVALDQTASTLDSITAQVGRTAGEARQAGEAAATARGEAERSGAVVRDAVAAMGEIEQSAGRIAQIIGVIDEIAFQTNLLALNAGVEAARAGDAGRGFAVVAQEVRALAQRSANAAKEIKALIQTSSAQVDSGVALVGETGEALRRIAGKVGEVDGLIGGIAETVQSQAAGLAQLNSAVGELDQTAKDDAALIERNAAGLEALRAGSADLVRLVDYFTPSPPPAARPVVALKTVGGRGASAQRRPDAYPDPQGW